MSIRIGLYGYGNLSRGCEYAIRKNPDTCLAAVFTRRDPSSVKIQDPVIPVVSSSEVSSWKDCIDVMIVCGGSRTDLPVQTPFLAKYFNVVDSFDTHANIPLHFSNVDSAAKASGKTAVISVGWDPGLFSVARAYSTAALPGGRDYTFWGKGVSQGHSDAIRRIEGVKDARQYTVPVESAVESVRRGEDPELTVRQKHTRECFVVAREGADKAKIEHDIITMPNYFDEYDTTVHFISEDELLRDHSGLPHGGSVIRTGSTGEGDSNRHFVEFSLKLDSNPEFTANVLVAYARAAYRLNLEGFSGCRTVLDIAPSYILPGDPADHRAHLL